MSNEMQKRTVSFSDIATYGRPALGLKDPEFDAATSREGLAIERRIKADLLIGQGPKSLQILASSATLQEERKFELQIEGGLYLTTTPDISYEGHGGIEIVEIKRRAEPAILDVIQAWIAIFVIGSQKKGPARAHIFYDGSGQMLTVGEESLDPDQIRDLNTIVVAADMIKIDKSVHELREWGDNPIKGGVEDRAVQAYHGFEAAIRRTGNRAALTISNQFPDLE